MHSIQVLNSEFANHPWITGWINAGYTIKNLEDPDQVDPSIPIAVGSNVLLPYVRRWLNQKQPALYIGRGYVGNHTQKKRRLWRVSVNGFANIDLRPIPHSRWPVMQLPRHPWKVKKVTRVLLAPSKNNTVAWSSAHSEHWAENLMTCFPGAEVRLRIKQPKPVHRWADLWQDLDWADLVVSHNSAITCEAFWYGKKVISLQPCPTWAAAKNTLADWQDPTEPSLRDAWHEHLAWSQFTVDEWSTGQALDLVQQYSGPIVTCDHAHDYEFVSTAVE